MKTIDVIVEGGKATAGPPLAPALAPMGVNIGQVVAKINEETKSLHTLNSTLIATSRVLVSILENFQDKDGHIAIPQVLQKYMGKNII